MEKPKIPFLATLNFPNLLKLTNNLVSHDPMWPIVPAKIPSDIPKFEGKNGEDLLASNTLWSILNTNNFK